jgi:2-polyprenyl-6-methoxyphenol hydroxylase-like FAD-dependent oxidoreductase
MVTLIERRTLPTDQAEPTTIAPQGRFPHLLLAGGAAALDRLAPGYLDDLFAHGAAGVRGGDVPGYQWTRSGIGTSFLDVGTPIPFCTRALIESRLRVHVQSLPNVNILDETTVRGLTVQQQRVVAVDVARDGVRERLDADLVVDASGRNAGASSWLADAGLSAPVTTKVEVGITYTALQVERRQGDIGGGLFAFVLNTPELARVGVALAAEGDRWQIVLGGYFGDAAAPTRAGVMDFASSLPDPVIAQLLENRWVSDPAQFRFPHSRRQHWEKVRGLPASLVIVGDAVASFNPLYGQGMSSAALQAEALGVCLDRVGNSRRLPRAVARAAGRVVASPWQIATGGDFVYPQTRGRRPLGTDRVNRYIARLVGAAMSDAEVGRAFLEVQNLLAPPSSLFRPTVVRRVLTARRPSEVPAE